MSVWWLLLIAYVAGALATVVPFARATLRHNPYYCADRAASVHRPCPDDDYSHRRCGPRDPESIGASAIGQSLVWPVILGAYSLFLAWDGLALLVGRTAGAGRSVSPRRLSELERELGINDA